MSKARFIKLKKPGIRKDTVTGKYQARKTIKGKTYSRLLDSVREAEIWRNTYNPFEAKKKGDKTMTFSELWEKYKRSEYPSLSQSSIETKEYQISIFWDELAEIEVGALDPDFLSQLIQDKKNGLAPSSKRYNFDRPLNELKTLFNWYKENEDYTFSLPVLKRHYKQGTIKKIVKKRKHLSLREMELFIKSFDKRMYRNLAFLQFLMGCRICEIAALKKQNINFKEEVLEIGNSVVWSRYNRKCIEIKPHTKNGEIKEIPLSNEVLISVLKEQIEASPNELLFCDSKGQPLSYRMIQFQFNKALKKAGLYGKVRSTHFVRHSTGTSSRDLIGIEAAQAILGHKDIKTTQIYAQLPTKLIGESIKKMSESLELDEQLGTKVEQNGLDGKKT